MANNDLSQETREKLEIARSQVRRVVTYSFTGVMGFGLLYALMWMGERSALTAIISIGTLLLGFWFGQRSKEK